MEPLHDRDMEPTPQPTVLTPSQPSDPTAVLPKTRRKYRAASSGVKLQATQLVLEEECAIEGAVEIMDMGASALQEQLKAICADPRAHGFPRTDYHSNGQVKRLVIAHLSKMRTVREDVLFFPDKEGVPKGTSVKKLLRIINNSRTSIYVNMWTIPSNAIVSALIRAKEERLVDVVIVADLAELKKNK